MMEKRSHSSFLIIYGYAHESEKETDSKYIYILPNEMILNETWKKKLKYICYFQFLCDFPQHPHFLVLCLSMGSF